MILGALVYRFRGAITLEGFRWSLLISSIRDARYSFLLFGVLGTYFAYLIRSLRWMRFSQSLGPTRLSHVLPATIMGFAAVFMLGRVGEPVRPLLIARKDKVPVASTFGIWVLERVMDAAAAAVLAGLALLVYASREFPGGKDD
ncbi:MAG: lysylphosphatidylglycerol synthase domain-containing protein, partial [Candidatus Acidiferrales bacterium]